MSVVLADELFPFGLSTEPCAKSLPIDSVGELNGIAGPLVDQSPADAFFCRAEREVDQPALRVLLFATAIG